MDETCWPAAGPEADLMHALHMSQAPPLPSVPELADTSVEQAMVVSIAGFTEVVTSISYATDEQNASGRAKLARSSAHPPSAGLLQWHMEQDSKMKLLPAGPLDLASLAHYLL